MVWLVVLLGVAVIALAVVLAITARRLRAESELHKAADVRADERAEELRVASEALEHARQQRAAAEEETRAAVAGRAAAEETARAAEERATTAIAGATAARSEADAAQAEAERAVLARDEARAEAERAQIARDEARAAADRTGARGEAASERPAGETPEGEGLDAGFLWDLERARSERTWRQSVALSPDEESIFDRTENQLIEAIRIDLEAAREEVGVVVDLDADLTVPLSAAGSLLTLRAAQELLAGVVRNSESSVMRLRVEGDDILVTVDAVDERGERVVPPSLGDSSAISQVDGGVRIHGVVQRIS